MELTQDGVNQKFLLCEASLKIGDWKTACDVINKYESNHVMSHRPITTAACNLVEYYVEKLYKKFVYFFKKISFCKLKKKAVM